MILSLTRWFFVNRFQPEDRSYGKSPMMEKMLSDTIELVLSLPISKDMRWSNLKYLKLVLIYAKYEEADIGNDFDEFDN